MKIEELISSGLLELYVLGDTVPEEDILIDGLRLLHPQINEEIANIESTLEKYAFQHAIQPDPIVKPFLLATIDFIDRMKAGEDFSAVPKVLNHNSTAADYEQWISRPDMVLPEYFEDVFAKILSHTPEGITAIAWIKHMAPQEVHDHEYEKFLILEGTCTIFIENEQHSLQPGDYLAIPLHKKHHVIVTSSIPCKAILQRIAA